MQDEKPLTPEEVAERLRVNENTVRGWIRTGKLRALDIGGKYRIFPSDLEDFIQKRMTDRKKHGEKDNDQ